MHPAIFFSGSPLDRCHTRRRDERWLAGQLAAESARFLPLWRLQLLVKTGPPRALAWARRILFEEIDPAPEPVLLGVSGGTAHFAVDVSPLEKPEHALGLGDVARFEDLRAVAPDLPPGEAAIGAQARSLVDWHARHRHCAVCGGPSRSVAGGAQRTCIECSAEHFPRTDPVAIALVTRGDRCLLGRQRGWPARLFSALAGFVEPGETLEEAVRREVHEESGVVVGEVRYVASQPWPFPSSLMIGCLARAESEEIEIDPAELEEAAWFSRADVAQALAQESPELVVPPRFALACELLRRWVEEG